MERTRRDGLGLDTWVKDKRTWAKSDMDYELGDSKRIRGYMAEPDQNKARNGTKTGKAKAWMDKFTGRQRGINSHGSSSRNCNALVIT